MNTDLWKQLLIHEEGLKLSPYYDSEGVLTIGVGHNIQSEHLPDEMQAKVDAGQDLSEDDVMILLDADMHVVLDEVSELPWFEDLSDVRKTVICDLVFNMGLHRFLGFKHMIKAIEEGDFKKAAEEMMNSKWAQDVGDRAILLEHMMETDSA